MSAPRRAAFPKILSCCVLLAVASASGAQQRYTPIQQRLDAAQMRATGLDQLTPQQLSLLNELLQQEQVVQAKAVREEAKAERSGGGIFDRGEPVVSKLVGTFEGWSNGTRFTLENGQVWRVVDTPEYYIPKSKYLAAPAVVLAPGLSGAMFMQVQGQRMRAKVRAVK